MKRWPPRRKRLVTLLVLGALIIVMLRWFEHSQVYHPDRVLTGAASQLDRPFEDVNFEAQDGTHLHGWFFPGNSDSPRAKQALLYCHGNAGNIGDRLDVAEVLLETGLSLFLFDYRGYGKSLGRPGEKGTYLDAEAACQWLRQKGFATSNIFVFGESLGGGVASELAARQPLRGLILQSTFSSVPDLGAELFPWLPVRWLSTIKYDTCARLPGLNMPLLVMHSRADTLIRFHHAEKNFKYANDPKLLWEIKGDHNDPLTDRALFRAGLEKFLKTVEQPANLP